MLSALISRGAGLSPRRYKNLFMVHRFLLDKNRGHYPHTFQDFMRGAEERVLMELKDELNMVPPSFEVLCSTLDEIEKSCKKYLQGEDHVPVTSGLVELAKGCMQPENWSVFQLGFDRVTGILETAFPESEQWQNTVAQELGSTAERNMNAVCNAIEALLKKMQRIEKRLNALKQDVETHGLSREIAIWEKMGTEGFVAEKTVALVQEFLRAMEPADLKSVRDGNSSAIKASSHVLVSRVLAGFTDRRAQGLVEANCLFLIMLPPDQVEEMCPETLELDMWQLVQCNKEFNYSVTMRAMMSWGTEDLILGKKLFTGNCLSSKGLTTMRLRIAKRKRNAEKLERVKESRKKAGVCIAEKLHAGNKLIDFLAKFDITSLSYAEAVESVAAYLRSQNLTKCLQDLSRGQDTTYELMQRRMYEVWQAGLAGKELPNPDFFRSWPVVKRSKALISNLRRVIDINVGVHLETYKKIALEFQA